MRLTAPTKMVFYVSVLAMVVGLVLYLFMDDMKDLGYYVTLEKEARGVQHTRSQPA